MPMRTTLQHYKTYATPHTILEQASLYTLRAFIPQMISKTPIVLCYSLVNRACILDLAKSHSLIQALLQQGYPVYLIDWHYSKNEPHPVTLEDYVSKALLSAFKQCQKHASLCRLNLWGICQGGNFALFHAALHPETVASLTLINTPIDFHTQTDTISKLIGGMHYANFLDHIGDLPGAMLAQFFVGLRPFHFIGKSWAARDSHFKKAFDTWLRQPPDLACNALIDYINLCYRDNHIMKKRFMLGKTAIDLDRIPGITHIIMASDDHITPRASAEALTSLIPTETTLIPGGHIGILLSHATEIALCRKLTRMLA